jgi:DNA-directed RNA polymerase subunit M/transcription elongation factor TFIIS
MRGFKVHPLPSPSRYSASSCSLQVRNSSTGQPTSRRLRVGRMIIVAARSDFEAPSRSEDSPHAIITRMSDETELELVCPSCGATQLCSPAIMLERLRGLGLLRRQAKPDADTVKELFRSSASKFTCTDCGHPGLSVRAAAVEQWPEQRSCEICGSAIPPERIEIFPQAVRCATCEANPQRAGQDEREFCPRCGEVMSVRLSPRGGISRYAVICPRCKS